MNSFVDSWIQLASTGKSCFEQVGLPDVNESIIRSVVDEMLYLTEPFYLSYKEKPSSSGPR